MPETPAVRPWPFLLLLAIQVASAISASQPWHCAPCSAEKLALCPPVPASCPEVSRPAGCGCCPMCALPLGAACGVATARCARGLSCRALPGEPRPLHALTRGQGSCVLDSSASDAETSGTVASGSQVPLPGRGPCEVQGLVPSPPWEELREPGPALPVGAGVRGKCCWRGGS